MSQPCSAAVGGAAAATERDKDDDDVEDAVVMYAAADMREALKTATDDDASVVYWFNETDERRAHLTYLKDEDDAEAQAMYCRIKEKRGEVITFIRKRNPMKIKTNGLFCNHFFEFFSVRYD